MDVVQQISTLRKEGQLDEALEIAKPALMETPDNLYLRRAVGWLFYNLIKRDVEGFQAQRISRGQLIAHLNEWLLEYARGGKADCPGLLHSLLLTQVLKVSREWSRFLSFARWWDPSLLRPEDREPYELANGKSLASLEMRLYYAVGRALVANSEEHDPELQTWAVDLLDFALESHPEDQWLHYYKSKHLLDLGLSVEAREQLLPVMRRQRNASWAWALFGKTWDTVDADKAITCYFRAVQVARKGIEVLRIRERLAELLAQNDRYGEAALQVRKALQCREQNGYRFPQELERLASSDWYKRHVDLPSITKEPDVTRAANDLIFGADADDVIYRLGVLDNQNKAKSLAHVTFSPETGAILKYSVMKGISGVAVGTCVEVGFIDGDNRPVTFRHSVETEIPGVCEQFEGKLTQRKGQAFAFVVCSGGARIFVHPGLAGKLEDLIDEEVTCQAVCGKDKKGRTGWKAIAVDSPASSAKRLAIVN